MKLKPGSIDADKFHSLVERIQDHEQGAEVAAKVILNIGVTLANELGMSNDQEIGLFAHKMANEGFDYFSGKVEPLMKGMEKLYEDISEEELVASMSLDDAENEIMVTQEIMGDYEDDENEQGVKRCKAWLDLLYNRLDQLKGAEG